VRQFNEMALQKKTIKLAGNEIQVTDIPAVESKEFFNEYKLEDGSEIRVKTVATSILRIDGEYNPDGTPLYVVLTAPVVSVAQAPKELSRK
jgi:CRISPR/Cas system endoribonuclease Cas6 (RAMP superfamily)